MESSFKLRDQSITLSRDFYKYKEERVKTSESQRDRSCIYIYSHSNSLCIDPQKYVPAGGSSGCSNFKEVTLKMRGPARKEKE